MSNQDWKEFKERVLPVPDDPAKGPDLSHIAEVHFNRGDTLKAINVLEEDGEPCEGRLQQDELVKMMSHSSELHPYIVVKRYNGRLVQLKKERFVLHERLKLLVESEHNAAEIHLAKKLAIYHKEESERQGISYPEWEEMGQANKSHYLHMARQLITSTWVNDV